MLWVDGNVVGYGKRAEPISTANIINKATSNAKLMRLMLRIVTVFLSLRNEWFFVLLTRPIRNSPSPIRMAGWANKRRSEVNSEGVKPELDPLL